MNLRKTNILLFVIAFFSSCYWSPTLFKGQNIEEGLIVFEDHKIKRKDWEQNNLNINIVIGGADGTSRRILAKHGELPKWFPFGDRIIYFVPIFPASEADDSSNDIGKSLIVKLDGTLEKSIPYKVSSISPDGTKLLLRFREYIDQAPKELKSEEKFRHDYLKNLLPERKGEEIFVYDLNSDHVSKIFGLKNLPEGMTANSLTNARWFPDGNKILFRINFQDSSFKDHAIGHSIGIINSNGTDFKLITPIPNKKTDSDFAGPWSFDISPDGGKIVYNEYLTKPARSSEIFIINSDGTNKRQITHPGMFAKSVPSYKSHPHWSPNGQKIMYDVDYPSDINPEQFLMVMNSDGSKQRRVFPRSIKGILGQFLPMFTLLEGDENVDWWAPSTK